MESAQSGHSTSLSPLDRSPSLSEPARPVRSKHGHFHCRLTREEKCSYCAGLSVGSTAAAIAGVAVGVYTNPMTGLFASVLAFPTSCMGAMYTTECCYPGDIHDRQVTVTQPRSHLSLIPAEETV